MNPYYGAEEEEAMLTGGMGGGAAPAGTMSNQSSVPRGVKGPLTPQQELARMMIKQAPYGQRERELEGQMQMANELRGTKTPGMYGNSRVQTAASPLEHIGAVGSRLAGDWRRGQVEQQQRGLFDERMGALGMKKNAMGQWEDLMGGMGQ